MDPPLRNRWQIRVIDADRIACVPALQGSSPRRASALDISQTTVRDMLYSATAQRRGNWLQLAAERSANEK